jgi:hypothetical protein
MLRRLLDWLVGRKEPDLKLDEKDRRLQALSKQLEVVRRGRQ